MKSVNLTTDKVGLDDVIELAREEPILILTRDGKEFCLAEADDFEKEVAALRGSQAFQQFLNERSACAGRVPLEEIERELQQSTE